MFGFYEKKVVMPTPEVALPGQANPIPTATNHFVNGHPLKGPYPDGFETAVFGMGCFWGAERLFWKMPGVWVTAVGYSGGLTPNPTYRETTTGLTGHAEVVLVIFDPAVISYGTLLKTFFEEHDPTQGMRQGNDVGTTYRSTIYTTTPQQEHEALEAQDAFAAALQKAGHRNPITTEIAPLGPFYFAEPDHQQYLAKVPDGYCGLKGTGVTCPVARD